MTNASTPFRVAAKATPTPSVDWDKAPAALRINLLEQLVKNEKHHTARLVPQWWKAHVRHWLMDSERAYAPSLLRPFMTLAWVSVVYLSVIALIVAYSHHALKADGLAFIFFVISILTLVFSILLNSWRSSVKERDYEARALLVTLPTPIAVWLAFKEIYAWLLFTYKLTVYNGDMEMAGWTIGEGVAHLEAAMKPVLDEHQTAYARFVALRKTWTTQVDECETNRKRHELQAQTHNANKETYLAQAMRKSAQEQLERAKTYQRLIDALSLLLSELDNRIREFAGLHKQQLLPLAKHLHHLKTKEALVPTDTTEAELRARMVTLHSEIQSLVMQAQEVAEGRVYTRIESATEQADPVLVEAQRDVENLLKKRS